MKLKNKIIRTVVSVLILCFVLTACLTGCSSKGKTLISLDGHTLSVNLYQLMLSQQKGMMAYSIYSEYGSHSSEKFWGMTIDMATQKTNADHYSELVLERAKKYLCALALFDELERTKSDFNFPSAYEKNIDAAIQNMIDVDAGGSKTKLNSILHDYGVNVEMLRDYLIMDAKANYVVDYLYGADGSKIGDAVKNQYYTENYVSCKKIIFQKFYYVYETDEDGNIIYYSAESGYPIYDTKKTPKYNADGTSVVDKHGNRIYYNEDGSIAYDEIHGVKRVKTDEISGAEITQKYSDEKINALRETANKLTAELYGKGESVFESMRIEHSEDYSPDDKTGGRMFFDVNIDFSSYTSSFFDNITDSLEKMNVGDVKLLEDDATFTIIIKTDLEPNAWKDENYEAFFKDEIYGMTDFANNLKTELYDTRLMGYMDKVKVDNAVLESIDFSISTIVPNYYYPDPDVAYYLYKEE